MKTPNDEIPKTPKKAKAFDQKFMRPDELATRWGLSLSSVYQGKSDVSLLRRIKFGKSVRFLRQQVVQVEEQKAGVEA
ncbi:MAG TPA: hypothetical protein VK582_07605 [Pyrinomonadaceae bacterium]|nr:hypothetical protein [Pyrinomonadaceae bacterium]